MLTSARNCFYGKVGSIEKGVVSAEVSLSIGSEKIVATITNESLKRMKLGIDDTIYALVKSSSIILTKHKPTNISARNVITAKVDDVISGAVNTEVKMSIDSDNTMTAVVTKESAEELMIKPNDEIYAIFKASSVILGIH